MKLKYKTETGEIVAMGAFRDDFTAGDGETVEEIDEPIVDNLSQKKVDLKQLPKIVIIEKSKEEQVEADKETKPIKKQKFYEKFNALPEGKKNVIVEELIARMATIVLTEKELDELIG